MKSQLSIIFSLVIFLGLLSSAEAAPVAKNIILFIGDGMGPQQLGCLLNHQKIRGKGSTAVERFLNKGVQGLSLTSPLDGHVTDSAAAATAIACARKTLPGMVGLDCRGKAVESLLERAKKLGKGTGLISTIRVTDATPAAFASHIHSRYLQRQIASQLLKTEVDVLLGGGARYFLPQGTNLRDSFPGLYIGDAYFEKSNRRDDRNLIDEAKRIGYRTILDSDEFHSLDGASCDKLLALFASDAMPYRIDVQNQKHKIPTLREMTEKALSVLSRREKGFFLMVEGAKIDWACHANDAASLLGELYDFDEAIAAGLDFCRQRKDTLMVLLADHETGGFSFAYKKLRQKAVEYDIANNEKWKPHLDYISRNTVKRMERQNASFAQIMYEAGNDKNKLIELVKKHTGYELSDKAARRIFLRDKNTGNQYTNDFSDFYPYRRNHSPALLARALASRSGIVWASGSHSATPVVVGAKGVGEQLFKGVHHHVDVSLKMFSLLK